MCFQDDPATEMTQIDLWKSYQGTFLAYASSHPHLIAGEFIKNVSNTFNGASAQVASQNKYVIRGIKPRKTPVDSEGRSLIQCHWTTGKDSINDASSSIFAGSDSDECGQWFRDKESLFRYILTRYLQIPEKKADVLEAEAGSRQTPESSLFPLWRFDYAAAPTDKERRCRWSSCKHVVDIDTARPALSWKLLARHIDTHLPDGPKTSAGKDKQGGKAQAEVGGVHWLNPGVDETLKDPCGLPLGAVLCLRNIARGLGRLPTEGEIVEQAIHAVSGGQSDNEDDEIVARPVKGDDGEDEEKQQAERKDPSATRKATLLRQVFGNVRPRLFFTLGHNRVLREYVGDVLRSLAKSGAF